MHKIKRKKSENRIAGLLGLILSLFSSRSPAKTDHRRALQNDFRTGTQKMNLTFTEKIRNHFRRKWLRKSYRQ
jgi:hypothetical protein